MSPSGSMLAFLALCVAYASLQLAAAYSHAGQERRTRMGQARLALLIGFCILALARLGGVI